MNDLFKKPSAWVPIVLSLTVLAVILVSFRIFGTPAHQPDEGTGAHLFQIWFVLEVIMILFFAVKWLPHRLKPTLIILVLQIISALAACAPVFYLKL